MIYQWVAPIVLDPQTLLEPTIKEIIPDTASGGAWVKRTPLQVSRTGVDVSTPGDIHHGVSAIEAPSPVLIEIVTTSPPCGINATQKVANKRQSTSPVLVGHTQKLDAVVDGKLPDNLYSASIFSKAISHKLSNGSSGDLYMGFRMKFSANPVQTQTQNS